MNEQERKRQALLAAFDDAVDPDGFSLEGYELLGELDRGGMAVVYRARQLNPAREVALKVMLPRYAGEQEMRARFQTEARAMAALDHPGVLPIYQVGEAQKMPFFSMKLAEGGSLAARLHKNTPSFQQAVGWMIAVADAVHFAHQRGVLHRDLKPGNFLFDHQERIYVGDFGVAKIPLNEDPRLTQTQGIVGTPHYLAPEIASGSATEASVAGDLYSLGAVFYECLTGNRPHHEHTQVASLLRAIVDEDIIPPRTIKGNVPVDLEVICRKALEKDPAARYASVAEFRDDLIRWQEGRVILARPAGLLKRSWRWAKRHPLPASLIAAIIVMAIGGGISLAMLSYQRGVALHETLLGRAQGERLLAAPGFRDRGLGFLQESADLASSPKIRDEAIALLAKLDISPIENGASLPWRPVLDEQDQTRDSRLSPDGKRLLSFHQSGRAALWEATTQKQLHLWEPAPGLTIVGDFLPHQDGILIGGLSAELRLLTGPELRPGKSYPLTEFPNFLKASPDGQKAAIGTIHGLELLDLTSGKELWQSSLGNTRCAPAWTHDGQLLASALGEKKEIVLFHSQSHKPIATYSISGWPEYLQFHPEGHLLTVIADNETLIVINVTENRIVHEFPISSETVSPVIFSKGGDEFSIGSQIWKLHRPVGYHEWHSHLRLPGDTTVHSAKLSPNEQWLITVTTAGLQLWDTQHGRQTDFHGVENQRIDAKTDAWWESDQQILIQIPGGLERVTLTPSGHFMTSTPVDREPGMQILDIRRNGDWLVSSFNQEEKRTLQIWPNGKAHPNTKSLPQEWIPTPRLEAADNNTSAFVTKEQQIQVQGAYQFLLTLPRKMNIHQILLSQDGTRLIGVSEEDHVFAWDLPAIEAKLKKLGL